MTTAQQAILTALHEHGPATAAVIAERAGLAYSTVTASLRKLAAAGQVHRDETSTWTATTVSEQTTSVVQPAVAAEPIVADGESDAVATAEPSADNGQSGDSPASDATTVSVPDPTEGANTVPHSDDTAPMRAPGDSADPVSHGEPADPADAGTGVPASADPAASEPQPDPAATTVTGHVGEQPSGDATETKPRRPYTRSGKPTRKKHQLQGEVLAYLMARPGEQTTPRMIAKAVDASDGAVINACTKLAHDGAIERVDTTKALFVYDPDTSATPAS